MRVGIINYGMGNINSVAKAFSRLGVVPCIFERPIDVPADCMRLILPGVGAFPDGIKNLKRAGWSNYLKDYLINSNNRLLGICLGMQMLATNSSEGGGDEPGLNLIPGRVISLDAMGCSLRIPHVGWNEVRINQQHLLLNDIPNLSDFYFVHGFAYLPDNSLDLIGVAEYDVPISAVIANRNVYGCQFHPEKSSKAGLELLNNFIYRSC